jgi:hypothetical protein
MKIHKFNENQMLWTKERIKSFCFQYESFKDSIEKYIEWKLDYNGDDEYVLFDGCTKTSSVNNLIIDYLDENGNEYDYEIDNYDELVQFMNDPELCKNANNYNL